MPTILDRLGTGARVAVIRLRSLGDCVLTTPAIELLKCARPDLRIAVVVEDRFAAVFRHNPAVSRVLRPSMRAVAGWHPRLAINLHGGTRSQLLTLASLARFRAGFAHHRGAAIYSVRIPRAQQVLGVERTVHTAEHLASAMFHLGVPAGEIPRARLYAERRPVVRPYAVIHPTAAASYKTWPAPRFLAVAEHIERERGLEPIFIGAATDDLTPFRPYRVVSGAPLGKVMALAAGASLFVGNDSGPAHLACGLGVPVVVLYGRVEHQAIWSPWRPVAARTLVSRQGISGIHVSEVLRAIGEVREGGLEPPVG